MRHELQIVTFVQTKPALTGREEVQREARGGLYDRGHEHDRDRHRHDAVAERRRRGRFTHVSPKQHLALSKRESDAKMLYASGEPRAWPRKADLLGFVHGRGHVSQESCCLKRWSADASPLTQV